MKRMQPRIIETCFGRFIIERNLLTHEALAVCCADSEFYYTLPRDNMTDEEIKKYFEQLREFER